MEGLVDTTSLWMKDIGLSRVGLLRDWDETGCVPKGWNLPLTNAYMLRATCYVLHDWWATGAFTLGSSSSTAVTHCSTGPLNNILH